MTKPQKQYRIEHDTECESPCESSIAEVWSTVNNDMHKRYKNWHYTSDLTSTLDKLQSDGYTCVEFIGEIWCVSAATLAKQFANVDQAIARLQYEQFAFAVWSSGECYRYVIYEVQQCNLGHEHEVEVDSCSGFYGYTSATEAANRAIK